MAPTNQARTTGMMAQQETPQQGGGVNYNAVLAQNADQFNQALAQNQANWENQYNTVLGQVDTNNANWAKALWQGQQTGYANIGEARKGTFPTGQTGEYGEPVGYVEDPKYPGWMIPSTEDAKYPFNKMMARFYAANEKYLASVKSATTEAELKAATQAFNTEYGTIQSDFNTDQQTYSNRQPITKVGQAQLNSSANTDPYGGNWDPNTYWGNTPSGMGTT
jgi:hypothetical protein